MDLIRPGVRKFEKATHSLTLLLLCERNKNAAAKTLLFAFSRPFFAWPSARDAQQWQIQGNDECMRLHFFSRRQPSANANWPESIRRLSSGWHTAACHPPLARPRAQIFAFATQAINKGEKTKIKTPRTNWCHFNSIRMHNLWVRTELETDSSFMSLFYFTRKL